MSVYRTTGLQIFPKHLCLGVPQPKIKVYWTTGPMSVCFPDHDLQSLNAFKSRLSAAFFAVSSPRLLFIRLCDALRFSTCRFQSDFNFIIM